MSGLSSTKREQLYDAEAAKALEAGRGEYPICNICELPVQPGQAWDESHEKMKPRWLGGEIEGIAHRRCNRRWNNVHDTPLFHKSNRIRQRHIGAKVRKGRPMVGTIDSGIKLRIGGGRPIDRRTGREL